MESLRLVVPAVTGRKVRLEPLSDEHVDGLIVAAAEGRDTYGHTTVPNGRAEVEAYVRTNAVAMARGETIAFAQVRTDDDRVVGATRFLSLRFRDDCTTPYAVEIGGTWLAASAQRTGINVEAKLLLLSYAFDVWRVGRVDFKTDARNDRSRTAIAGLGAVFEGILRNWQPSHAVGEQGLLRDTAIFSIVTADWPAVRTRLVDRLTNHR